MQKSPLFLIPWACLLVANLASAASRSERSITAETLRDKLNGFWIGQLAGNYVGFPFENLYVEQPLPILVDRILDFRDAEKLGLQMNLNDRRGYLPIMADAMGGAWSDDDTDIEFVTLHAVEKYGLDLTYPEITTMWQAHINRFIWSAARRTRDLMEEGLVPPATGSREHNEHWYRITSQLMTEIWGAFYPGMTAQAAARAEWGARIITDDWAVHPDIVYGVMFSAAFFEDDPRKLVELGLAALPPESPFARGMRDVMRWHDTYPDDWRETRRLLHGHYVDEIDGFEIPYRVGGSIINGLCSIMALLYGEGDFMRTVGIATAAGYDCDNQAATCGGLIGIMHGAKAIPEKLTHQLPSRGRWEKPFNDTYINYSRDGLPNFNRISDIVDRIMAVSEQAILAAGGSRNETPAGVVYRVRSDLPEVATDFSGRWQIDQSNRNSGVVITTYLILEQSGTALDGSVVINNAMDSALSDVVVSDHRVEFRDVWGFRYVLTPSSVGDAPQVQLFYSEKNGRMFLAKAAPLADTMPPPRISPAPMVDLPADGLALTPPMGWNSWNRFKGSIDDAAVREVADALVESGLRDAGYVYVCIDDTWAGDRDADGNLQPNAKFPDMKALGDYLHDRGLKFGIYSSPGPVTCGGYAGSYGYEERDARMFAEWGVDYLKYDWCSAMRVYEPEEQPAVFQRMAQALRATGRPIIYSVCQYGLYDPWTWAPAAGGHLWRTTDDIQNNWESVAQIGFSQSPLADFAGPGRWNDPDMLEIGNGGLSRVESRTHFTLWCLLAAPLMAGNDVRTMTPETVAILTQPELIAINQDSLGEQARRVWSDDNGVEIWTRRLANGDLAAGVFNRGDTTATFDVSWPSFGLTEAPFAVRDIWSATDWETGTPGPTIELPPHGCLALRIKPSIR